MAIANQNNDPSQIFVTDNLILSWNEDTEANGDYDNLPNFVDTALPSGSYTLGLVPTGGAVISRTVNSTVLDALQQDSVRLLITGGTFTVAVNALESNQAAKSLYYAISQTPGAREIKPSGTKNVVLYLDMFDSVNGYEKVERFSFVCTVTPNGDVTKAKGAAAELPLLFTPVGRIKYTDALDAS